MDFPSPNSNPIPNPTMPQQPVSAMPVPPMPAAPAMAPVQPVSSAMSSNDAVYTMPEKFLNTGTGAGAPAPKKKSSLLTYVLIAVIALAVLGIIGGILFYILQTQNTTPDTNTNTANTANVADTNATNTNTTNTNVTNTNTANTNNVNATNSNVANVNAANTNTTNTNVTNTNTANTNTTNTNTAVTDDALSKVGLTNTNTATTIPSSKDTDQDQLTNDEEQLYSTKADLPDTDNDGYNDGVEVLAGYDPTNATSAGRLTTNTAIATTYVNDEFHYSVVYPAKWLAEALSEGSNKEIIYTPKSLDTAGQFVEVLVVDNPTGFTALDWYVDQTKVAEASVTTITSFAGLAGVLSADGSTAYYADSNHIYAVSYRYGSSTELYFKTTFALMYKSFTLNVASASATNTNSNGNRNSANANANKNSN